MREKQPSNPLKNWELIHYMYAIGERRALR